jgi:hypothetical protein
MRSWYGQPHLRLRDPAPDNGGMETKRPYYRHKWQWAEAKAAELHAQATARRQDHYLSSDWRSIRRKTESIGNLLEEASRFRQMAQRFKAQGI